MNEYIRKVIENLTVQRDALPDVAQEIIELDEKTSTSCNALIFSVIKRAIDIIDTFLYATSTYNINTQIPLIRLQVDNCLILQVALLYKSNPDIVKQILEPEFRINKLSDPANAGKKLSEHKVAKIITTRFPEFEDLYAFCCRFVHFSNKATVSLVKEITDDNIHISLAVGNKNLINDVMTNANSLISINKVLAYLIDVCYDELTKTTE